MTQNEEFLNAWNEVTLLAPEGSRMALHQRDEGTWETWVKSPGHAASGFGYGVTPVEALNRLSDKLKKG